MDTSLILRKTEYRMNRSLYYTTPRCLLVPQILFTEQKRDLIFREIFPETENDLPEEIFRADLPDDKAVVLYSLPVPLIEKTKAGAETGSLPLPILHLLIRKSSAIPAYNKVLFYYPDSSEKKHMQMRTELSGSGESSGAESGRERYLYLVIREGERLLLANAYRAPHPTTALYFLFLAVKQIQFNPEQTRIFFGGAPDPAEKELLERYFQGADPLPLPEEDIITNSMQ